MLASLTRREKAHFLLPRRFPPRFCSANRNQKSKKLFLLLFFLLCVFWSLSMHIKLQKYFHSYLLWLFESHNFHTQCHMTKKSTRQATKQKSLNLLLGIFFALSLHATTRLYGIQMKHFTSYDGKTEWKSLNLLQSSRNKTFGIFSLLLHSK